MSGSRSVQIRDRAPIPPNHIQQSIGAAYHTAWRRPLKRKNPSPFSEKFSTGGKEETTGV